MNGTNVKTRFHLVFRSGQFFQQDSQRLQMLRFGLSPAIDWNRRQKLCITNIYWPVASPVTVSQKHKCPTSGRKELFCYSVDEKKHFQKDNRRCCGITVHLAALSTRQLDFSRSSVSLFQHTCRNDKNIVAFQHVSFTFQVQEQLNYVSEKCPNKKLVILCLTTTKSKMKFSQSMLEFFFLSFVSMDGTFLLAIYQDTCKS